MHPYVTIFGKTLPSYGLCLAAGIIVASCLGVYRAKKAGRDFDSLIVIAAFAFLMALIGAKLAYILVSYGFTRALGEMLRGDFSVFAGSGEVFYGGLLLSIPGAFMGARFTKVRLADYSDIAVPCIPLGHAFGRLGCFLGGCCYGMPYEGPGAVCMPAVGVNYGVFPVQLLEAILNVGICLCLLGFTRRKQAGYRTLYLYMLLYAPVRFCLEFLRGDAVRGIAAGISTSQWISIALFCAGLCLWLRSARRAE